MNTNIPNYTTWEETMKATVNGDISLDEAQPLAMECAEIADRSPTTRRSNHKKSAKKNDSADRLTQCCSTMPGYFEQLRQNSVSPIKDIERIKKAIIECGKAADAVQSKETVGASA